MTSRVEKAEEASRLGFAIDRIDLDLPEPQALDPAVVAREKVESAWKRLRRPVLVEDSGLEILAWGGFPGGLVKWMEKSAGLDGIVRMLDPFPNRSAQAVCAIACFDGERLLAARGTVEGSIAPAPRGEAGFGWDSIFIPTGSVRTFAEMASAEKDAVSHRGRAWRDLAGKLARV